MMLYELQVLIASSEMGEKIINSEMADIWKEVAVAYFKMSQHSPRETEESHEKLVRNLNWVHPHTRLERCKTGHDRFLSCPSHFIIHSHPIFRRCRYMSFAAD
jgi:hypothetical protein